MDEMEFVVGGLAYIYRHAVGNGKFDIICSTTELTKEQCLAIYKAKLRDDENSVETFAKAAGIKFTPGLNIKRGHGCRNYQLYKQQNIKNYGGLGGEGVF